MKIVLGRRAVAARSGLIAAALMLMVGGHLAAGPALAAPANDLAFAPANQLTFARVISRYGAALRESADPRAPVLHRAWCNEIFVVVGDNGPWRQVFMVVGLPDEQTEDEDDDIFAWVRDDHIAVGPAPAGVDCGAAKSFSPDNGAESWTDSGCLTLRSEAGGGGESECRPDGVVYRVTNGPTMAGGEEWFELEPPGGGPGWSPGRFLIPVP